MTISITIRLEDGRSSGTTTIAPDADLALEPEAFAARYAVPSIIAAQTALGLMPPPPGKSEKV